MGYRYGRSDINKISVWDMVNRYEILVIDMIIHHMVILGIVMGYGLMIWEMTESIWSSPISICDILSQTGFPCWLELGGDGEEMDKPACMRTHHVFAVTYWRGSIDSKIVKL